MCFLRMLLLTVSTLSWWPRTCDAASALKLSHFEANHSSAVGYCSQKYGGNLFEITSRDDTDRLERFLHKSSFVKPAKVGDDARHCMAIVVSEGRSFGFRSIGCDAELRFVCRIPKREPQNRLDKRAAAAASYSFLFVNKNLLKMVVPETPPFESNACKSFAIKDNYENSLASRVVGGETAHYGSQPWQVEIAKLKQGRSEHHCSGVIVNELFIISTAHCFSKTHARYLQSLRVITGDHDIELRDKHEAEYEIERIAIHPKHLASLYANDIAVLKVKAKMGRGIVFGSHVKPACMPRYDTPHRPGTECEVSGWGLTEDSLTANVSTVLRSARVKLMSTEQCRDLYANYNPVNDGMLCAGHLRGGVDSCRGDSGGPLVCNTTGVVRLFGLVSWGDGCALPNRPGVYVRIQHYLKWIAEMIDEMS